MADDVHPSFQGHKMVAVLSVDQFVESGNVAPPSLLWDDRRDEFVQQHAQSLPTPYYLRGRQNVEHLRVWSRVGLAVKNGLSHLTDS